MKTEMKDYSILISLTYFFISWHYIHVFHVSYPVSCSLPVSYGNVLMTVCHDRSIVACCRSSLSPWRSLFAPPLDLMEGWSIGECLPDNWYMIKDFRANSRISLPKEEVYCTRWAETDVTQKMVCHWFASQWLVIYLFINK